MAHLVTAPSHGAVRISLDGKSLGPPVAGFAVGPEPRSSAILGPTSPSVAADLGIATLRKGTATLRIEVVGKNERSWGHSRGLDCVVLRPASDMLNPGAGAGRRTRIDSGR